MTNDESTKKRMNVRMLVAALLILIAVPATAEPTIYRWWLNRTLAAHENDPNPIAALPIGHIATSRAYPVRFEREVLDKRSYWEGRKGKVIIDPDGNGAVSGAQSGPHGFVLYPPGKPPVVISKFSGEAGLEEAQAADLTGNGAPDIVAGGLDALTYFLKNPRTSSCGDVYRCTWRLEIVDKKHTSHDVVVADMNGNGANDIVTESGVYFNRDHGQAWQFIDRARIQRDGEGTSVGDVAGDHILDIVAPYKGGTELAVFVNPRHHDGDPEAEDWAIHVIDAHPPFFGNMTTAVADVNGSGRNDIILAPMYGGGGLVWYQNPGTAGGTWVRRTIDPTVNYVHQGSLQIADFNGDGLNDIAFAEQDQSPTRRIGIFYKLDKSGSRWKLQVLSTNGGHNIKVGRIENDPLPSILSARHGLFHWADPLVLFRNRSRVVR